MKRISAVIPPTSTVRIRLLVDGEIARGPGKAELLDAIGTSGSISAAAKTLDMSYRRAWLLVETMPGMIFNKSAFILRGRCGRDANSKFR